MKSQPVPGTQIPLRSDVVGQGREHLPELLRGQLAQGVGEGVRRDLGGSLP